MITVDYIESLINGLPDLIKYIAFGYIFLSAFYWVTYRDNADNTFKYMIVKSIIVNYILVSFYSVVLSRIGIVIIYSPKQIIFLSLLSGFLGLIIGSIIRAEWFGNLLLKLHISRTFNSNIWDDVLKKDTWVRVYMKDGTSYFGCFMYSEDYEREPIIVLSTYRKYNAATEEVLNYTDKPEELIMLNTANFDRIEITHN